MRVALIAQPSRFNKQIKFGTIQSVENANHVSVPTFVPSITCYCAIWNKTLNQQFQVVGTALENTITVIVRHRDALNESMLAQLGGVNYTIVVYAEGTQSPVINYDTITLKKVSK
jgi:SPP1 family predicted phage head-tail adaptor